MERMKPEMDQQKWKALQDHADHGQGLIAALAGNAYYRYDPVRYTALHNAIRELYGKPLADVSAEEFLCPELKRAFAALAGKDMAEKLPHIIAMCLEGQFSYSPSRRSYRSRHFSFYSWQMPDLLCDLIRLSCYPETVKEWLYRTETHSGYTYLLALEIRRNNEEIISLLHEAAMGDNSEIILTRTIIIAIVISGHEGLLDDLVKLLLAARLQEGLRQQILESADAGSTEVLARILKVCIDENLFRYSSVIRAFDTWTGMGYGDAKPAAVKAYAQLAYECLTDEAKRQAYYQSKNNTEAYFALWAQGCHEYMGTYDAIGQLLADSRHYRQVLGWFFITQMDNRRNQMILASRHLEERDEELLAWIVSNLTETTDFYSYNWNPDCHLPGQGIANPDLPDSPEERKRIFGQLKQIADLIGDRKPTFSGNPFDFVHIALEGTRVYGCMIALAGYDMDQELVDELLALAPKMAVYQRKMIIKAFLVPNRNAGHRSFLRDCLNDQSIPVREAAVKRLAECSLSPRDLEVLGDGLRSKSSDLRSGIMAVLKKQDVDLLYPLITRLLQSPEENQYRAAIELISELKDQHPKLLADNQNALTALREKKLSTQTEILLKPLLAEKKEEIVFTRENGFGLYDHAVIENYLSSLDAPIRKPGLLSRIFGSGDDLLTAKEIRAIIPTKNELDMLMERIDQVFVRHADEEIEVVKDNGARQKILFGDPVNHMMLPANSGYRSLRSSGARLEMIPFWSEFREALGEYSRDIRRMLGLFHRTTPSIEPFFSSFVFSSWYESIAALGLVPQTNDRRSDKYPRRLQMHEIFGCLYQLFDPHEVFVEAIRLYRSIIAIWGEENLSKVYQKAKESSHFSMYADNWYATGINHQMLYTWRLLIHHLQLNTEDFAAWFTLQYRLERQVNVSVMEGLETGEYFRAYHENIIPRDILVAYLLDGDACMPYKIRMLTDPARRADGRRIYEDYPWARELMSEVIDRVVTVEEKRGELPTPMTGHCQAIERFEGAEHFCNLLAALGKENFCRGYAYYHNDTKQAVLSRLLKRCYPAKGDTPERLAALLKATDISDRRLAEAVMYAPQWAGFAEKILGWPGLKCGVWFFHAHISEMFSAEKETETAIYSPISPKQFNDGAFDQHWFFEAHNKLGEKRFQILYKSAKYITSGNNQHRRSQLYSDAVLGKLDAEALKQEIIEKRNQEKLRCYPLIPIKEGDHQEALRRYEFIQKFLKESKQFGAQRRESEKKACAVAMENLAITTGLMDVNRLMWQMESQKIEEIKPLMEPVTLDGITMRLTIDENGDAGIAMEKGGKAVKTPPKTLAKNSSYLDLKVTVKELKDLKRRSRESMERAMTNGTAFGAEELRNICLNPILAPMVLRLVWTDGKNDGFLQQSAEGLILVRLDGQRVSTSTLRIAHPYDLKVHGNWAQFIHLLYEEKLIQPFKQVFREYYPLTDDERQERTISRRYAGHQVQPQRAVALLKGRGWTVDYEEGLQKVFYKENLIVRMFAMADWFSPADIEAPTLETVEFFDRGSGENVPLEKVPPILFSEAMRDLDLVVSVAHVGGVDPEASHSTVDMRVAIATELAQLLKLSNVSWIGSHAKIHGTLANYSVHMGSGVVHAEGVGMVSILPVHSQARGRIFLPFADDDPKTAEIMSKILLLAEDKKIKDPAILNQISR